MTQEHAVRLIMLKKGSVTFRLYGEVDDARRERELRELDRRCEQLKGK